MANDYDAIVIGGGIIGCAVAWRLAQTGRRVALLERGHVGGEASSAAGGIFCPKASPDTPDHLFQFWRASHDLYPSFVAEVQAATGQAFELRVAGQLAVAFTDEEVARLARGFPLQAPAGVRAQWLDGADARVAEPALAPDVQAAIYYPDHILVDNARLTHALGGAVRRAGGDLFENRPVTGLVVDHDRVTGVETPTGALNGAIVVNCAGSWSGAIDARARQRVWPIKGQMLAVDARPVFFEHIVQGAGGGIVPRADGRTLVGATREDVGFDKDVIAGGISALFERVARMLPALRQARFLDAWAGLRPMTPDGEPLIGPDPKLAGLFWATGHWTMGILMAPATARAVAELIDTGRSSIPIDRFGVERFTVTQPI
ncbi:MAG: glycine oxidase ThiO [Chloroflexota bacterium]